MFGLAAATLTAPLSASAAPAERLVTPIAAPAVIRAHGSAVLQTRTAPHIVATAFTALGAGDSTCSCPSSGVGIAAGDTQLVETVNSDLAVYTKGGTLLAESSLLSLFPGNGGAITQPKVSYDAAADRFVLVAAQNLDTPRHRR